MKLAARLLKVSANILKQALTAGLQRHETLHRAQGADGVGHFNFKSKAGGMGNSYNGYSWNQREQILHAQKRIAPDDPRLSYMQSTSPCEICADPGNSDHPVNQWHSEDYSRPYLFSPPATFIVCNVCHLRLHTRFPDKDGKVSDWKVYLAHLGSGGYGREFTTHSRKERLAWQAQLDAGEAITLVGKRPRKLTGREWWQTLSLDPESLNAPWARPRPWDERPSTAEYRAALQKVQPTILEMALLRTHANSPKRCATMRQLADKVFSSPSPFAANLMYGRLAHRLADALSSTWVPKKRVDQSNMWMTTIAEGWKPPGKEFEWVMVPDLASIFC